MSGNELENLMSQLHMNSEFNTDIHDLGIQTFGTRTTWSYKEEPEYTRDGHKRKKPLPITILQKKVDTPIPYVPKLNEFVIDDANNRHETFKIPMKGARMDFEVLTKKEIWIMFWFEHWRRTSITKAYYKLLENIEGNRTRDRVRSDDRTGGSKKILPSIVTNGSVTTRRQKATSSGNSGIVPRPFVGNKFQK